MGGIDVASKLLQLLLISVVCALVELIPVGQPHESTFCVVRYRPTDCTCDDVMHLLILSAIFIPGDDNINVPVAAAVLSWALL
jgi:dolichol kinase